MYDDRKIFKLLVRSHPMFKSMGFPTHTCKPKWGKVFKE